MNKHGEVSSSFRRDARCLLRPSSLPRNARFFPRSDFRAGVPNRVILPSSSQLPGDSGAKQGTAVSGTTGNKRKLHLGADDRNVAESSFFVLALHVGCFGQRSANMACARHAVGVAISICQERLGRKLERRCHVFQILASPSAIVQPISDPRPSSLPPPFRVHPFLNKRQDERAVAMRNINRKGEGKATTKRKRYVEVDELRPDEFTVSCKLFVLAVSW